MPVLEHGASLRVTCIATRFGFGQTKTPKFFAAAQSGKILSFLRLATPTKNRHDAQGILSGHSGGLTRIDPRQFFDRQTITQIIRTLAAVLGINSHPEQTQLAHLQRKLFAEQFFLIELLTHGLDLSLGKITNSFF